ncbi:MAG TPA: SLBB domain-containing protein [Candidatus Limnocylindrales bacterium]|nr:SLBB domain-containing protein [Candidatus Limnocylindrales bacterium]
MDPSLPPTPGQMPSPAKPKYSRIAALAALLVLALPWPAPARAQTGEDFPPARSRTTATAPDAADRNLPIEGRVDPDTYRVGPGDEFAFRHSDLLDPKILRVSPAGEILFPDAGAVFVAGLTLREAGAKVREALRSYVRGKGLVFTLYRPRSFRLPVLGEVIHPGVVTLTAPVRASEAIEAAGGIAPGGARRGIIVRRGSDSLLVDLVSYRNAGDLSANPLVFETDVIFVPAMRRRVEIHGAVPHPGGYDLVPGDRVSDLLALAGGPLPEAALDRAEIEHINPDGASERSGIALDKDLLEGDRLFVPARAHYKEGALVRVEGEVFFPGTYSIKEGVDGVRGVIDRAGALTPFADVSRARIERRAESAGRDTAFLRLADQHQDFLNDDDKAYMKLRARERTAVSADLSSVLAGSGDVALLDGDRIVVPRRYPSVSVQGEVRSPGLVPFEAGRRAHDYVRAAGGFTDRARKSRMRVTVARTGQQMKAGEAGVLRAGDTVWVPTKPERNKWTTLRDVLTTAAQIATVYLVINQATK